MKAFLYRACAIIFSHFVLYPDYRISFFIPLAFRFADYTMDCACALENIFLAAKSLGIGSCWINQLGQTCDDPDVRAFLTKLGVPESHKVYGCAALGYAPADAPVKEKKVKEGTVTIIR